MYLISLCLVFTFLSQAFGLGEIIFALNAGGDAFTDSYGIRYRKDHLTEGTASDYGRMLDIKRVPSGDRVLYETERYHLDTFGYTIPMPSGDGDYVLWLKFCEVWFSAPGLKVFDVALNDNIVLEELDIFKNVGRGVAHDEVVPFQIRNNKMIIKGKKTSFNNEIRVDFLKGTQDNPKVNAIIILRGLPDQVPALPEYKKNAFHDMDDEDEDENEALLEEEDEEEDEQDIDDRRRRQLRNEDPEPPRKPKLYEFEHSEEIAADPYASEDTYLIPILVAIGAFIPLLFCLCKL